MYFDQQTESGVHYKNYVRLNNIYTVSQLKLQPNMANLSHRMYCNGMDFFLDNAVYNLIKDVFGHAVKAGPISIRTSTAVAEKADHTAFT